MNKENTTVSIAKFARNLQRLPNGDIYMEINHPVMGWSPFAASARDTEEHGRDLHKLAEAGEFGEIAPAAEASEQEGESP